MGNDTIVVALDHGGLVAGSTVVWGLALLRYGTVAIFGDWTPLGRMMWLHIAAEGGLVMWWTSTLWLCGALLSLVLSLAEQHRRLRIYWLLLAIGAVLLSLDEATQIHERVSQPVAELFRLSRAYFPPTWVLVAVPILLASALIFIPLLRRLPRLIALGLFASGVLFGFGAVGFEIAYGVLIAHGAPKWVIAVEYMAEEGLEMAGVTLFCAVLVRYLETYLGPVRAVWRDAGGRATGTS